MLSGKAGRSECLHRISEIIVRGSSTKQHIPELPAIPFHEKYPLPRECYGWGTSRECGPPFFSLCRDLNDLTIHQNSVPAKELLDLVADYATAEYNALEQEGL